MGSSITEVRVADNLKYSHIKTVKSNHTKSITERDSDDCSRKHGSAGTAFAIQARWSAFDYWSSPKVQFSRVHVILTLLLHDGKQRQENCLEACRYQKHRKDPALKQGGRQEMTPKLSSDLHSHRLVHTHTHTKISERKQRKGILVNCGRRKKIPFYQGVGLKESSRVNTCSPLQPTKPLIRASQWAPCQDKNCPQGP